MYIKQFKFIEKASKYHKRYFTKSFSPNGKIYRSFHLHIGQRCITFNFN